MKAHKTNLEAISENERTQAEKAELAKIIKDLEEIIPQQWSNYSLPSDEYHPGTLDTIHSRAYQGRPLRDSITASYDAVYFGR